MKSFSHYLSDCKMLWTDERVGREEGKKRGRELGVWVHEEGREGREGGVQTEEIMVCISRGKWKF